MGRKPYIFNEFDIDVLDLNDERNIKNAQYLRRPLDYNKQQVKLLSQKRRNIRNFINRKAIDLHTQGTSTCKDCGRTNNRRGWIIKRSKGTEKLLKRIIRDLTGKRILLAFRKVAIMRINHILKETEVICKSCYYKELHRKKPAIFSCLSIESKNIALGREGL